jgi:hypothetical protein
MIVARGKRGGSELSREAVEVDKGEVIAARNSGEEREILELVLEQEQVGEGDSSERHSTDKMRAWTRRKRR